MSAHPFWRMSRGFWAIRRAWCELTGGHVFHTWGAFMRRDTELASKVRIECERCGRGTAWVDTPKRDRFPAADEDALSEISWRQRQGGSE